MHLLLVMDLEEGSWHKAVDWESCPRVGDEVCILFGSPAAYSVVRLVSWGFDGEPRVVLNPRDVQPLDLFEDRGWVKYNPMEAWMNAAH